jgi:hypothetical protein
VAEQATGAVEETGGTGSPAHGTAHELEHNPGKPISWVATGVITVGFIVGIPAMVPHPVWWLFWVAVAIVVVGCIMTAAARTFHDDWY